MSKEICKTPKEAEDIWKEDPKKVSKTSKTSKEQLFYIKGTNYPVKYLKLSKLKLIEQNIETLGQFVDNYDMCYANLYYLRTNYDQSPRFYLIECDLQTGNAVGDYALRVAMHEALEFGCNPEYLYPFMEEFNE